MKPAYFDYERPETINDALKLIKNAGDNGKILAGGQSLGPMLNMRLITPKILIDISRISELTDVADDGDALRFGACVTHSAVEDNRVPDVTLGMMPTIAKGIAYRAVRNKGTIGGSLSHADPAADWNTALIALSSEALIVGPEGARKISLDQFFYSAFDTVLTSEELLTSILIPKLSDNARWGFFKYCRKVGEFADAMSAVVVDPDRNVTRAVIGATNTKPIVISNAEKLISEPETINDVIAQCNLDDDNYKIQAHRVALWRALQQVLKK
jgi:carbon-monoxide dehydrogenase medium subunit